MTQHDRYAHARKATLIGALINALLGLIKLIGGFFTHSHALVADGLHSFSDLLADGMVLFASKYGSVAADDSHPYGHQRIETAANLFLSILLILAGFGVIWDAVDELIHHSFTAPKFWALPIIVLSIVANEASFRYTRYVGQKINSQLILTNAWHHRSDALSSIVVLFGLIGSLMGYSYLDVVASALVGISIIKMGWDYSWHSVKELIDTAVDEALLRQIEQVIRAVNGVKKIHQLRSRFMGHDILIDVHILVSPKISVSEGHYIAQHVHQALMKQIDRIKDVIVHVDPEDDELYCPSLHLPSRTVLEEQLFQTIHLDFPEILFWNLHYLDGKISIDLAYNKEFTDWESLHQRILIALELQTEINEVRLFRLENKISQETS
jgi:cation diffusion facilitator family transporter